MKLTQNQRVERMLRDAGSRGVTNGAFAAAGILRYAARIEELRKDGLVIETVRVSGGTFRYTLASDPRAADPTPPPLAEQPVAGETLALFNQSDSDRETVADYRDWDSEAA